MKKGIVKIKKSRTKIIQIQAFGKTCLIALTNKGDLYEYYPKNFENDQWFKIKIPKNL